MNVSSKNKWFSKEHNSCWGTLFGYSGIDKLAVCSRLISHFENNKVTPFNFHEFDVLAQGRLGAILQKYSAVFASNEVVKVIKGYKHPADSAVASVSSVRVNLA